MSKDFDATVGHEQAKPAASAGPSAPFPATGDVIVGSNQQPIPFSWWYSSQGRVYYNCQWPIQSGGNLKMVLGVSASGVTTPAQAQAAIQKVADTAPRWKDFPVPLPF